VPTGQGRKDKGKAKEQEPVVFKDAFAPVGAPEQTGAGGEPIMGASTSTAVSSATVVPQPAVAMVAPAGQVASAVLPLPPPRASAPVSPVEPDVVHFNDGTTLEDLVDDVITTPDLDVNAGYEISPSMVRNNIKCKLSRVDAVIVGTTLFVLALTGWFSLPIAWDMFRTVQWSAMGIVSMYGSFSTHENWMFFSRLCFFETLNWVADYTFAYLIANVLSARLCLSVLTRRISLHPLVNTANKQLRLKDTRPASRRAQDMVKACTNTCEIRITQVALGSLRAFMSCRLVASVLVSVYFSIAEVEYQFVTCPLYYWWPTVFTVAMGYTIMIKIYHDNVAHCVGQRGRHCALPSVSLTVIPYVPAWLTQCIVEIGPEVDDHTAALHARVKILAYSNIFVDQRYYADLVLGTLAAFDIVRRAQASGFPIARSLLTLGGGRL